MLSSKGLRTLYQAVQMFRDLDPDVPTATLATFLLVAEEGEGDIHMRDLQSAMDSTTSSTSRNVAYLSAHHRLGKPGLGLVETYEDLEDRRFKRVRLTAKGRGLKARLTNLVG